MRSDAPDASDERYEDNGEDGAVDETEDKPRRLSMFFEVLF